MRNLVHFFRENSALLIFGMLLTFSSGFGQTFLLSLYIPEIAKEFSISHGTFGSYYAIATIVSALSLAKAGSYIDRVNLRTFTLVVIGGLVLSLLVLSKASNIFLLIAGIWGLRLSGQGLMGHAAVTTMARFFDKVRGKAISLTSLGYPASEAVLPIIIAFTILQFGWRNSLLINAFFVLLVVPPVIYVLLNKRRDVLLPQNFFNRTSSEGGNDPGEKKVFSQRKTLKSSTFWLLAPNIFIVAFLNTAIFFFQIPLGVSKGWEPEWIAGSIAAFAIASATLMLVAGPLVDRFRASRLFPFYMLPYLLGFILLLSFDNRWIYPLSLFLMGASNGLGSTIKNAVQAEMFNVRFLGSVRSLFSALMVLSTAMGPLLFGVLLDHGITFHQILLFCVFYLIATILYSLRILPAGSARQTFVKIKRRVYVRA
jgi:MFS family permease